jgi:hypothetical protein
VFSLPSQRGAPVMATTGVQDRRVARAVCYQFPKSATNQGRSRELDVGFVAENVAM